MAQTRQNTFFLILIAVLLSGICSGQAPGTPPSTGPQPFGSFGGGPFDTLNLGNLNVHFSISVVHKAGRGLPFNYDLSYDSSVWYPTGVSGSQTWTSVPNWGWRGWTESALGYTTYSVGTTKCFNDDGTWRWGQTIHGLTYHDTWGASHYFAISLRCGDGTGTAPASDGSGYTATFPNRILTRGGQNLVVPQNTTTGAGTSTDRNGNQIGVNGSGVFTDTLGTTALTISGTTSTNFTYTGPQNTSVSLVMHYAPYTIKTNFGCSSIAEFGPVSASLASDVTLPDGSQYTFQYEPTPGFTGDVTGRLKSVTLPTGGTINYTYTGGNNGVICADGSTAGLTRQLNPGGTWTYARADVSGSHWTTTVTDPTTPTHNQTVLDFQEDTATVNPTNNFYETQRLSYQGATTGTLQQTQITCYNGHSVATPANCPTTAVASPFTRKTAFDFLPDANGKRAETDITYSSSSGSAGLVSALNEYDFGVDGSGAVGALIRQTGTSFATLGQPAQITVQDGSNNVIALTAYTYDEGAVTATTGTPQHIAVSSTRGNLTTLDMRALNQQHELFRKFTYYDTGTLNTSTDVSISSATNGPTTTYIYGASSCGNSFATQVNRPLSLSHSMTWNCAGGVQLSATDENGNVVSTTYNDQYFWRPTKSTDQLNNDTTITYPSPTAIESAFSVNSAMSTVDTRSTVDGFGRPVLTQRKQGPSATNYDSTETDYDVAGRVAKTTLAYAATAGSPCTGACPGTTVAYDALSRPTTFTDGGGGTVTYTYIKNDVLRTVGPAPSGENTKRKQSEYDALGRLTSVCEVTSGSGSGSCAQTSPQTGYWTTYTYDTANRLTGVIQNAQAASGSRQARSYAFDWLGRMTSETNPETGTTAYVYDTDTTCGTSAGNLVKRTDQVGNVTCYGYDLVHRILSVTYPTGSYSAATPQKHFVYDTATVNGTAVSNAKGRLAEAYTCTTCSPTLTKIADLWYSYSKRGEATDGYESTPHSGATPYHVTNSYWEHGALKTMFGIPGVPTVYYGASDGSGIDTEGRLTKVGVSGAGQTLVTGVAYTTSGTTQPIGSLTQMTFGSLDNDNFSYDTSTGRLTQYQFKMGATPQTDTGALTWNANGTLRSLAITDQINSVENQTCNYTYDDLSRQATANCGMAWNQSFSSDPFGNTSKTATVGTAFQATYSPTTNRLTQVGSMVPTYDGNGNLTNDTTHSYTWDAEGKMVSADGSAVTLTYDALGRMVEQARGTNYTEILYGPSGSKLALMTAQTLQKAFVPLPGGATAVYNSNGLAYYRHSDWLGSARLATTPTRTKYYDVAYAPYGENYSGSGTTPDLSFTGQSPDTVSWLNDFMYREYSSVQGRWISPDPGGGATGDPANPQRWNRYSYVHNGPTNAVDPLGLTDEFGGKEICIDGYGDVIKCLGGGDGGGGDGGGGDTGFGSNGGWGSGGNPYDARIGDIGTIMSILSGATASRAFWGMDWYSLPRMGGPSGQEEAVYDQMVGDTIQAWLEEQKKKDKPPDAPQENIIGPTTCGTDINGNPIIGASWGTFGGCSLNDTFNLLLTGGSCATKPSGDQCYQQASSPGCSVMFCPGAYRPINNDCTDFLARFPIRQTSSCTHPDGPPPL